jgi:D-alanyl-D-alanine carboxypeptidase
LSNPFKTRVLPVCYARSIAGGEKRVVPLSLRSVLLTSLLAVPLEACAAPVPPVAEPSALPWAEAEFERFPPPGAAAALIESGRSRYFTRGLERLGEKRAVTRDTVFQIASLTKPFTAIVILRLAEQGRLGLDDPAARYLDWLPATYQGVTVRRLLNHTAGVPRDLRRENVDEFTIEEFRRRFLEAEPSFPAGDRWEYSNTGYILLSLIAERAGGRSLGALLADFIFQPLAMSRTNYRAPLGVRSGRAQGHDWQEESWRAAPAIYSGFGNSGIESTAADLARFAAALQRRQLLRPESYRAMLAPAVLASGEKVDFPFRDVPASYGLGWFLTDFCGNPVATHGGTIAGFSAGLFWATGRPLSAVALANGKSGPDRIGVAEKIAAKLLRGALSCEG